MRIRCIKPDFWTDSFMVQLPHFYRLFYVALWNVADDSGIIYDDPEKLAMEIMPREDVLDVDEALQFFIAAGKLETWVHDATQFVFYKIAAWSAHQKIDHPSKSRIYREGSRKIAISSEVKRGVASKYGCPPGGSADANCYYCGSAGRAHWIKNKNGLPSSWAVFPGLEMDHLYPEVLGFSGEIDNIVLACRHCNRSKGTKFWVGMMGWRPEGAAKLAPWNMTRPILELSRGVAPDMDMKGKGINISSPNFAAFWDAYGKKVGKKSAQAEWKRIAKPIPTDDEIIAAVDRYLMEKPDPKFRLDPERWIKHRRWEDETPAPADPTGHTWDGIDEDDPIFENKEIFG